MPEKQRGMDLFKLRRLVQEPILEPIEENHWESKAVFNAAAVYHNGYIHLFYRACNNTFEALSLPYPDEKYKFISSIGYAKVRMELILKGSLSQLLQAKAFRKRGVWKTLA